MPNHVVNYLKLDGDPEKVKALLSQIRNDEYGPGTIDFNKIKPMPEALQIEAGSRTDHGLKAYRDFIEIYTLGGTREVDLANIPKEAEQVFLRQRTDVKSDEWELGKQAFRNIQDYGAPTWYEWCISHWGTKWNAYGYDPGGDYGSNNSIYMQTAWSAPHPVIQKLAQQNPAIRFTHEWADEDIGQNCGRHEYYDGERTEEYYPLSNKDCIDFATGLWEQDPEDWGLTLNASENGYITTNAEEFELVSIFDQPALFTNARMTADDIPKGLYCYHLRDSDVGDRFATIEHKVSVNFGGTLITSEPLDFKGLEHIPLDVDTTPNFLGGKDLSFDQFMRGDFDDDMTESTSTQEMQI